MKRFTFLLAMLMLSGVSATAATTFDFVVATTNASETFKFQVDGASASLAINWGDGNNETLSGAGIKSHTYATAGTFTNQVSGTATRIAFGGTGTTPLLLRDIVSRLSDGVTGITLATEMFYGAANITQFTQADWFDAASSNVTYMISMFRQATNFNQDISNWNVSKVYSMASMFRLASAFNQDIGNWNVKKVFLMANMFAGASAFNKNIGNWDVGYAGDMGNMFENASAFNQNIGGWSVSNVISMQYMFSGASVFNQAIGNWNVKKVYAMTGMFASATNFNQNIGGWNVSSATAMDNMFNNARKFNQDIGNWNVSIVTTMNSMFWDARAFNQDIGRWDVSKVTDMYAMLYQATAFKQDISRWNVSKVGSFTHFMTGASLPTDIYNQLLIRWSHLPLKSGLKFFGGNSTYDNGLPAECRQYIIDTFGWTTFIDGGTTGKPYKAPVTVLSIR